jgi:hypothetical protein
MNETYALKRRQPDSLNSNDCIQPPRKRAAVFETTNYYSASTVSSHELWNVDGSRWPCTEDSRTDSSLVAPNEDQVVCFGMVRISGSVNGGAWRLKTTSTREFEVELDNSQGFHCINDASIRGQIGLDFIDVTNACCDNEDLTLQLLCYADATQSSIAPVSIPCRLDMILFGPHSLFDDVGSFFEEHNIFLQDPIGCSQNLLYRNPHKLSTESGPDIWTFDLVEKSATTVTVENVHDSFESIGILNSQQDWAESQQLGSIRTSMQRW